VIKNYVTLIESESTLENILEKQIKFFCVIVYLTLKVELIGYLLFSIGHLLTFILGNTTLSLYFQYNINYFDLVSIHSYAFCCLLFEKNPVGYSREIVGPIPPKHLICFADICSLV